MFPFASAGGRPPGFYQIDRSLRFNDDDSAYLSRTPGSAGNRRTFTWSGWAKRANISTDGVLFGYYNSGTNLGTLRFDSTNIIRFVEIQTGTVADLQTTALYRDPSAWYHIVLAVDTTQATSADRIKLYVNGVQVTAFGTATYYSLNFDTDFNRTYAHNIGRSGAGTQYFDGYLAEVHFIDGTALDPTSFGEFDQNGLWRPINVTGLTYGTNGFYLSFADNTSTTTLGYDDAGSNDWTLNNFSVAAGVGNDSLEDTPTNNFATLSPIDISVASAGTLSNGNLQFSVSSASRAANSTIAVVSGQQGYAEFVVTAANRQVVGAVENGVTSFSGNCVYYRADGNVYLNNVLQGANSSYTTNDVIAVCVDGTTRAVTFRKNDVAQTYGGTIGGGAPLLMMCGSDSSGAGTTTIAVNFGQRPFAYTPPTGYSALCTANLPTPDIADPGEYMNAVTYTGNGSTQSITGVGFQANLVWLKSRSTANSHFLGDTARGFDADGYYGLQSNTTNDELTGVTNLTSIDADGFSLGSNAGTNGAAATFVAWCWREGVTPGFDVVTYTGTGVARTISHNLGTVPKLIIVKARSTASTDQGWPVYHASNTAAPETDYLLLNSTAATADLDTVWNDTAPTASVFSVGTNALVNALNDTYVAYLWSEVEGFSKFGSYTGNGSADGPFVHCGFRPRYILIKRTNAVASWVVFDAARNTFNIVQNYLLPDSSAAEGTGVSTFDFLSNGFKMRSTSADSNASGGTYIFAAFAEQPFSAPSNAR